MTREPEVVMYYTLEEAKRLIRREDVRKRKRFWRSAKQKIVGNGCRDYFCLTKHTI